LREGGRECCSAGTTVAVKTQAAKKAAERNATLLFITWDRERPTTYIYHHPPDTHTHTHTHG